jgi:hypothetical protein
MEATNQLYIECAGPDLIRREEITVDRNRPQWKIAADLAQRLTVCRDIEKRTEILAAAHEEGDVWRTALLLAWDVAKTCPTAARDPRERPVLNRLAPPKCPIPLARACAGIGDVRAPAAPPAQEPAAPAGRTVCVETTVRRFLAEVFALMAYGSDPDVRDSALILMFHRIRENLPLIRSSVLLCLEASDTIRGIG